MAYAFQMRGRAPQAVRGRARGAGAYGTRIRMPTLFGALLCLPTAPGLPLCETETSVRRRFLGSSRTSRRLPVFGYVGCRT